MLSNVARQFGEGLVLARNGATYISAVPSSLAAVNSSCLLGSSVQNIVKSLEATHNLGSQS